MQHNTLNTMKAKSLDAGKYNDGQGLWLHKRSKGHGRWFLRIVVGGKRREMGLGPWPDVSIAEARENAALARKQVRSGLDPVFERQKSRKQQNRLSIADAINSCFEARKAELKNDGKAGGWLSPLTTHVLPQYGKQAIEDVDQHILKEMLTPIWHEKADVARKVLMRMNLTLTHAAALGLDVDLQAPLKARALLGKQRHETKHVPSLPYKEVPTFYQHICNSASTSCLALRLIILTVSRTSEVRFLTLDEIHGDVWILPAKRTKTNREHRIPLTTEALKVIEIAQQQSTSNYLFPSPTGKAMSNMAMAQYMKRQNLEARPHGFRASFRTWAEEQTDAEHAVMESCLGHVVDKGVIGAYQRGDRLEKRSTLLQKWQEYLIFNQ